MVEWTILFRKLRKYLAWPNVIFKQHPKEDIADEITKVVTNTANKLDIINISNIIPIEKFSSRLLVVTCYVNRFINNIQKSKKKLAGTIGFEGKNNALNMWIQSEQKCIIFSKKFKQQCKSLQLFLVKDNLYHIRNRFDNEKTLFDSIHPVFLPQSLLTNLIILEAHRKVAYAGIDATLTEIGSRYWISRVRQIIKHLLRNCVDCKREHKKPLIRPPPPKLPYLD